MAFKIRQGKKINDVAEYNKLKNKVKRKVRDLKNKYGKDFSEEFLPPKLTEFENRTAYNEWKQKASSFTNRNNLKYQFRKNKNGLVQSVAQLNEFQRLNRLERAHAKAKQKEIAKMPFSRHGEQIGTVGDRFGMMKRPKNIGFSPPAKFNFDNFYSYYDLNKRKQAMERRADPREIDRRLEAFKERYIIGVEHHFNSDANDFLDKIRGISAEDLYDLYLEHDEVQALFDGSPLEDYEGVQWIDQGEKMKMLGDANAIIDNYLNGKNEELRNFPSRW